MQWEFIVALVIAIPIILFPAAFVWYLNIGGIYAAIKEARTRRTAPQEKKPRKARIVADTKQNVAAVARKGQPGEKELVGNKR